MAPPNNQGPVRGRSSEDAPRNSETLDMANVFAEMWGTKFAKLEAIEQRTASLAIVPKGTELQSVKRFYDEFAAKPDRRKGTAQIRDKESFVAHVNRHKSDPTTVIFAVPDRTAPKLLAVYDYNPASGELSDARFMQHRAEYQVPTSDEWKAWMGINGRPLDPHTFSAFLEDRIADVMSSGEGDAKLDALADLLRGTWASAPMLMGLSRGIEVNVASKVKQAQTLATGEISVTFDEVHTDGSGQPIKVPNLFLIGIPVFYRGDRFPIVAKLRYRVQGGGIQWSIVLHQPEIAFDTAFDELCKDVAGVTERLVIRGTPEA
jgi:uncharacterized protein YfdQ (DUF2303 family)